MRRTLVPGPGLGGVAAPGDDGFPKEAPAMLQLHRRALLALAATASVPA